MADDDPGIPTLIPTATRDVDFYGDTISGALVQGDDDAQVYVPLRPLCEFMGLSWSGQRERTMRDEVLKEAIRFVRVTRTNSLGGRPDLLALPLKLLPGWLFGISADRIKDEAIKAKIIHYRRECYDVLWAAFKHDILQSAAIVPAATGGAALAYELATAVQNLAREQIEHEQRIGAIEGSQQRARQWAKGIESRVSALEMRLSPDTRISDAQAAELAQHVKAVAHALTQQGQASGYQTVYGELYRRFQIGTYKALPQGKFDDAIGWLKDWHRELSQDEQGEC